MSLLSELKSVIEARNIPIETGVFGDTAPDCYAVLTPMTDELILYSDNSPEREIQEVRVSLFDKGNYNSLKNLLTHDFLCADITITDRRLVGHEDDTGYFHYIFDTAKTYKLEG